jgi:hypothetical protein
LTYYYLLIGYFGLNLRELGGFVLFYSLNMKKQRLFFSLIFLIICIKSSCQSFKLTDPRLEFDGYKLSISYDIVNKSQFDVFFIWVEIKNQAGTTLRTRTIKGDCGDSISPGKEKTIIWVPEDDGVYLDEDVSVEIKGEKYLKSFNKGSMILLSTAVPGLGQTKISKGKPWWILGIPAYGTLAGGFMVHSGYLKTYDKYKIEVDPVERSDLFDKSQQQKRLSGILFVSAATIWAANIIWVAVTPNKYKPLEHARLTLNSVPFNQNRVTLLSLKVNF